MPEPELGDLLTLAGAVPVVVAIVQTLVKPLIPNDRLVPHAAVATGLLLTLAVALALGRTGTAELANAAFLGILAGLGAAGAYQVQKPAGLLAPKPPQTATATQTATQTATPDG